MSGTNAYPNSIYDLLHTIYTITSLRKSKIFVLKLFKSKMYYYCSNFYIVKEYQTFEKLKW